uniref:DDH family phosphohydrolase n=1 Tax=Clandestinovirus TaxID=2831644 RepID=A0A8F8KQT8_9VIRU|nr:DDH family phosphohydrolase [Clandestinovirus]
MLGFWCHPSTLDAVYYHKGCTDGAMAAAVALLYNPHLVVEPYGYDQSVDDLNIEGKTIMFVDVALTKAKYDQLFYKCKKLSILDHHSTAQQELYGLPGTFFDVNRSGCALAWEYFFPTHPVPRLLLYIEKRDLWKMDEEAEAFTTLFYKEFPPNPQVYWSLLIQNNQDLWFKSCIHLGRELKAQKDVVIKRLAEKSKTAVMKNLPQISVRVVQCSDHSIISDLGSYLANQHGVALVWYKDDRSGLYKGSLRSVEPHDCSIIATMFDGGGHKHASGFSTRLPIVGSYFEIQGSASPNQPVKKFKYRSRSLSNSPEQNSETFDKWAKDRQSKFNALPK